MADKNESNQTQASRKAESKPVPPPAIINTGTLITKGLSSERIETRISDSTASQNSDSSSQNSGSDSSSQSNDKD